MDKGFDNKQSTTAQSKIRSIPFREDAVSEIAHALGTTADLAPFQLPGARVYQLLVEGTGERPAAMVTLWPSLRRIDAIGNGSAVVFTRVASLQLVDDVEVLFRRESGEYLVVAKGGRIIVRA